MIKDAHREGPWIFKCLSDKIIQPINITTSELRQFQWFLPEILYMYIIDLRFLFSDEYPHTCQV